MTGREFLCAMAAAAWLVPGWGAVARSEEQKGTKTMDSERKLVHRAVGAGRWFSADSTALRKQVERFLHDAAAFASEGRIVAVITPHAGFDYSGAVAGHAFRALRDQAAADKAPETVVILGFTHQAAFRGVALLDGDAVETPFGETPLDREAAALLAAASDRIRFDSRPHRGEHSAENQIPFAQAALPAARLVVALMGEHSEETVNDMAAALAKLAKTRRIALVASTDLLHDPDYETVTRTDRATTDRIVAMKDGELRTSWRPDRQVCCGIGPTLTAIRFARGEGCGGGRLLRYRNSGDDHPASRGTWVVGYAAIAFPAGAQ